MREIQDNEVWTAIYLYVLESGISWNRLGSLTGNIRLCGQAAGGEYRPLPTDFLQGCVEVFVKQGSRVKFEETADSLPDQECRELLTARFRIGPTGCGDCPYRNTCDHRFDAGGLI